MAVGDASLSQIVRGKLQSDAIACQNADTIASEFTSQVREHASLLIQLDAEQTAGEFLNDGASDFNAIFFTHRPPSR